MVRNFFLIIDVLKNTWFSSSWHNSCVFLLILLIWGEIWPVQVLRFLDIPLFTWWELDEKVCKSNQTVYVNIFLWNVIAGRTRVYSRAAKIVTTSNCRKQRRKESQTHWGRKARVWSPPDRSLRRSAACWTWPYPQRRPRPNRTPAQTEQTPAAPGYGPTWDKKHCQRTSTTSQTRVCVSDVPVCHRSHQQVTTDRAHQQRELSDVNLPLSVTHQRPLQHKQIHNTLYSTGFLEIIQQHVTNFNKFITKYTLKTKGASRCHRRTFFV